MQKSNTLRAVLSSIVGWEQIRSTNIYWNTSCFYWLLVPSKNTLWLWIICTELLKCKYEKRAEFISNLHKSIICLFLLKHSLQCKSSFLIGIKTTILHQTVRWSVKHTGGVGHATHAVWQGPGTRRNPGSQETSQLALASPCICFCSYDADNWIHVGENFHDKYFE